MRWKLNSGRFNLSDAKYEKHQQLQEEAAGEQESPHPTPSQSSPGGLHHIRSYHVIWIRSGWGQMRMWYWVFDLNLPPVH